MESSEIPFHCRFVAMHFHPPQEHILRNGVAVPAWAQALPTSLGDAHKLREVMAGRDGRYALTGNVKSDKGFLSTEVPDDKKNEEPKRGVGGKPSGRITHGRLAEFGFSRTLQAKPV